MNNPTTCTLGIDQTQHPPININMDNYTPSVKRNKKSDKAKRNHELNGSTSSKHVRLVEAILEKRKYTRIAH